MHEIIPRVTNVLGSARGFRRQGAELATKIDDRLGPQIVREETAKIYAAKRQEAEAFVDSTGIRSKLAAALADAERRTDRTAYIETFPFRVGVTVSSPFEQAMLQKQEENLWVVRASHLSNTALEQQFKAAVSRGDYAVVRVLLNEAAARHERSPDSVNVMQRQFDQAHIPAVADAEAEAQELRGAQMWIDATLDDIETGNNAGLRAQKDYELRQRGASKDERRAVMGPLIADSVA